MRQLMVQNDEFFHTHTHTLSLTFSPVFEESNRSEESGRDPASRCRIAIQVPTSKIPTCPRPLYCTTFCIVRILLAFDNVLFSKQLVNGKLSFAQDTFDCVLIDISTMKRKASRTNDNASSSEQRNCGSLDCKYDKVRSKIAASP
jgi:hypothetical protein